MVLALVLAFVVVVSVRTFRQNNVLKFLSFFLHLLSVLFRCIELAVVSCFYIYLEWLCIFLLGCLLAVLYFLFFAQFVLPFLPLIFVEVDA